MQFDDLAERAAAAARARAAEAQPPTLAAVRRGRRIRSAAGAVAGAFVLTLVGIGVLGLFQVGSVDPDLAGPTTTQPPPTTATTTTSVTTTSTSPEVAPEGRPFSGSVWSIAHDPTWYRANSDLMPNLGWGSVTLATFPLRPGGERCAHMPENALRDLGPTDVLVTAFFSGPLSAAEAIPWPTDGFTDDLLPRGSPNDDVHECAERPELEAHWGLADNGGEGIYLLAAFGDEVADDVRAAAWRALSSLQLVDAGDGGLNCVVTVVRPPGLAVPDTHPAESVFGYWYGTTDLWTVLTADGSYGARKSVWWSAQFPGGDREERPEISVTWRRLDVAQPEIVSDRGTNAFTAEDGWFMISGGDPQADGCWEITATYKGATLSYVASIDG